MTPIARVPVRAELVEARMAGSWRSPFDRLRANGFCFVVAAVLPTPALAQSDYPARPVRVLIGQAPGGGNDIQTRLFGQKLSDSLGRAFIVENRPGASGIIAFRAVATAPPDGYTLLAVTGGYTIAPAVRTKLGYDPLKDLAPISLVVQAPFLLLVHPALPVKDVNALIALAKARPRELAFGSAGQGSSTHLAFALFTSLARIEFTHVPYKGTGPALVDAMAGEVQMLMGNVLSSLQHHRSGKLRALAVTTPKRSAAIPEIPAIAESLPGYEASTWHGWLAPAGTPAPIVRKLNAELAKAVKAPDVVARLTPAGAQPVGSTPDEFARFISAEIERWRKVVEAASIKLD